MKHIKTLTTRDLKESMKKGGCGECQTSCQSACKTSCTVGNQSCEQVKEKTKNCFAIISKQKCLQRQPHLWLSIKAAIHVAAYYSASGGRRKTGMELGKEEVV